MARYNTGAVKAKAPKVSSFIEVTSEQTTNHKGAAAWIRTPKAELFLLGASSFNEDSTYETAVDRNVRVRDLVKKIVAEDPQWLVDFVNWLRNKANIRTQSMIIALEGAKAMAEAGVAGGRKLVDVALQRADEPAEAIAYWHTTYCRKLPAAVKRGIADAAVRLYNERSVFKYDSKGKSVRFADVIQLVHPDPKNARQSDVFKFALDRRYNDNVEVPASLNVVAARQEVKQFSGAELRKMANEGTLTEFIRKSGMTWENVSSVIDGGMDAKAWESVIPVMGYMALLRNLRNFLDKGVSSRVLGAVLDKIRNPEEVAKSKQLPFRFMSALNEVGHNLVVAGALSEALDHSISNIPALDGKTLVLVDMSGSMFGYSPARDYATTAAIFGSALALKAEKADLVRFGTGSEKVTFKKGGSASHLAKKIKTSMGGTNTMGAVNAHFNGHDRVVVLTDEQADRYYGGHRYGNYGVDVPVYVWNLAGYKSSSAGADNVFTFGGLTDDSFKSIALIESAKDGKWPWLVE